MSVDHEPCRGALSHAPLPWWTQRHHVFPMYLSALLGIEDIHVLVPLCANCHERVHHAIRHLINTGEQTHRLSAGEQFLVNEAWSWWQAMLT